MASVLSAVSERRLRPIYEQLDNGNNKKAFHEAEKVLKKQKDLTAAKVLKTIALHRMGKEEEAFSLSQDIVALAPTDENSLQGLSLYFKEIRKTELICSMYEVAVKHCPHNEEYLTHLFMSYVRHEKFQQMQRVAMILYKQHPKNPYLFWGIMAIVLQALHTTDEKLAKNMYLPLAEKMIEKHIDKGKIEAEAEVRLYLLILDLAGKHEKVLQVLNSDLGKKLTTELYGFESAILCGKEKLQQWDEVNVEYKRLLNESPDVWNYALGYLNSFFHLLDENCKSSNGQHEETKSSLSIKPDHTLQKAFEFIMELVNVENDTENKKRGPYLLRLEMLKRLQHRDDSPQGSPWQILLEYALDFSTKPCCFHDLMTYFSLLTTKDTDKFLADLYEQQASFTYSEMNGECSDELKFEINRRKEKEIQRHIFTIEATRYLGKHESLWNEEKITLAKDYIRRHQDGLRYSNDRPLTDGHVVDPYCMFAVRLLIDIFLDTEDTTLLWRCVSVLEYGLKHSEYNYEMKFMLIRVYCRLGMFSPCASLYDSLEVKHMQQDTLGYTVCQHVASLGHFHLASQVFQLARSFYINNHKESVECLIACFRNGTFNKISELVEYRRTVQNSFHAALTSTEHVLMDLFTQGDIDQPASTLLPIVNEKRIDYDNLTDNRDFSFITDINPENKRLTKEMIDESFVEEKNWLRFRELLMRCVHSTLLQLHNDSQQQNGHSPEKDPCTELDNFLSEFEQFCANQPTVVTVYPFHGPHISRLHLYYEARYPHTMLLLLKYCRSLYNARNTETIEENDVSTNLTSAIFSINSFLETCNHGILIEPKSDDYYNEDDFDVDPDGSKYLSLLLEPIPDVLLSIRPCIVERLVLCTEMFSFCILLVTNMQHVVMETKADIQRRRRRKKGKSTPDALPSWIKGYQESITKLKVLGEDITSAVNQLKSDAETMIVNFDKSKVDEIVQATNEAILGRVSPKHVIIKKFEPIDKTIIVDKLESIKEEEATDVTEDGNTAERKEPEKHEHVEKQSNDTSDLSEGDREAPVTPDAIVLEAGDSKPIIPTGEERNNQTLDKLKDLTITENIAYLPHNSNYITMSPPEGRYDKVVRSASESFITSSKQMLAVLEGRMKNLKDIKL